MYYLDPSKILAFLFNHHELIKSLFEIYHNGSIISEHQFESLLSDYHSDIGHNLKKYKIIIREDDDYKMGQNYYDFLKSIYRAFKPLHPEHIAKFYSSIHELFLKLRLTEKDKNLILSVIESLSSEITDFISEVENNTFALLGKSQELKANIDRIDYIEKIKQANIWINVYVVPILNIIDRDNTDSIYSELLKISRFSNDQRFIEEYEEITFSYEKLNHLAKTVINTLDEQNKVLADALLPLLENIKTESLLLTGMYKYLSRRDFVNLKDHPSLPFVDFFHVYSNCWREDTALLFDQCLEIKPIYIKDNQIIYTNKSFWVFNKKKYADKLTKELPIYGFYRWCLNVLQEDNPDFTMEHFFQMNSLIFEKEFKVEYLAKNEALVIEKLKRKLRVPVLKITRSKNG
ncbi:MAG: hypothetical protein ACQESP_11520 [Candidatus Muiribacteriota bacterium]